MLDWIVFAAVNRLWYTLPLIVSVSLVYAATRHEQMAPILYHAVRTAVWIVGFMLVVLLVLWVVSLNL
jgi:hypothetical protein